LIFEDFWKIFEENSSLIKIQQQQKQRSVIQINQLTGCNSFTGLLLDVLCRSTCFGRLHTHNQELKTALTASGFTLERGGSGVVGRGLTGCEESG